MRPRRVSPAGRRKKGFSIGCFAFEAAAILVVLLVVAYAVAGTFIVARFAIRHYKILVLALILLIPPHFILRALGRNGLVWRDEIGVLCFFEEVFERREK